MTTSAPKVSGFQNIAVGDQCPHSFPGEGAVLKIDSSGITLFLNLSHPVEYERDALKSDHPARLGVLKHGRTGFLLADFGGQFCFDAPFDVGIQHPESIPDLSRAEIGWNVVLGVVGVDASSGRIFGIRVLTLSSHVSRVMARLIRRQSEEAVTLESNDKAILAAYRYYPSTQSMLKSAIMGKAGFDPDCTTVDGIIRVSTSTYDELRRHPSEVV